MTGWGTPERGAPVEGNVAGEEPETLERRAVTVGRSTLAPIVLALTTIAGLAGAVLALLPAAMKGRPAGRLGPHRAAEPRTSDTGGESLAP